jgi:hypothetical protein
MNENIADLVERLREFTRLIRSDETAHDCDAELMDEAADTLLSLQRDRDALREALAGIRWKSADRDNMEFAATITYSQMDRLRALLHPENEE